MKKKTTEKRNLNGWTRDELLALPIRKWDDESPKYTSVVLLPNRKRHESGWSQIHIIGTRDFTPVEIAASCPDSIEIVLPDVDEVWSERGAFGKVKLDCAWPSGAMHLWRREGYFTVSAALSSMTIRYFR